MFFFLCFPQIWQLRRSVTNAPKYAVYCYSRRSCFDIQCPSTMSRVKEWSAVSVLKILHFRMTELISLFYSRRVQAHCRRHRRPCEIIRETAYVIVSLPVGSGESERTVILTPPSPLPIWARVGLRCVELRSFFCSYQEQPWLWARRFSQSWRVRILDIGILWHLTRFADPPLLSSL